MSEQAQTAGQATQSPETQDKEVKFFYVIGGEYTDMTFSALRSGSAVMEGPYNSRDEAHKIWRKHSINSTDNVLSRYDIVELHHTINRQAMLALGAKG